MIRVTAFRGEEFVLNALLIETVKAEPDTIIQLFNGKTYLVKETKDQIIERTEAFYRSIGLVGTMFTRGEEDE
ncbi:MULTISPECIES: flagellar FlbD family protein [Exiguobacterium]|jgi:flagellar protein FlbD|uniref:Flagellar FlbD family protein n=2 Tax=Exiguobacterium TaxID=33986 RepID=A0ABW2PKT9_9BACL|nr:MULTISPECIES: flagellar FlbD family protein [Exiguobacterium]MCC9623617.1 flagellar FlbD family protein [Thalassospira sp. MA62]QLQ22227.1 MAG: flagellar FlbD family protein [Paracoccaceae bacterium]QPI66627.1 flagellar FlbD family protein [Exiguobacterium sp. PBE]MBG0916737.1 flagellar FlbD family protein [Exiguobacterium sp. SRB7LM]MBQ6458804.1 flagellar FlbD family protein [Exiguobacterium sp.]